MSVLRVRLEIKENVGPLEILHCVSLPYNKGFYVSVFLEISTEPPFMQK